MTTQTTVEISKARTIPVWLAVLLILLCAGGGGYLAYRFLLGGSDEKIVLLERSPNQRIQRNPRNPNVWIVPTENEQLTVNVADPAKPRLQYMVFRHDLTPEQNILLALGWRRDVANQIKITDAQWNSLRRLQNIAHVEPDKATMDALQVVFMQWLNAPIGKDKTDLETKLFAMLDDATKAIDAKSKAAAIAKADKVRALLTPEQVQQVPKLKLPW